MNNKSSISSLELIVKIDQQIVQRAFHRLPEDVEMIRDLCRSFADNELAPIASEVDKKHMYPKEQISQMTEMGLMGINVPEEFGGAGMSALAYAVSCEEISRGCASAGVIMRLKPNLWPFLFSLTVVQNFLRVFSKFYF